MSFVNIGASSFFVCVFVGFPWAHTSMPLCLCPFLIIFFVGLFFPFVLSYFALFGSVLSYLNLFFIIPLIPLHFLNRGEHSMN